MMRNSQTVLLALVFGGSIYGCQRFAQAFSSLSPIRSFHQQTPECLHAVMASQETITTTAKVDSKPISVSSQVFSSSVDMNQYNLAESEIPEQWTANLKAATEMTEAGAFLGAKNSKDNFVDTIKMVITCPRPGEGLGIELLELAGGRSDGLGITIVSGLVTGKCSESSGLQFGDSIAQISLRRRVKDAESSSSSSSSSFEEIQSVATECLAYDGTIDAVLSVLDTAASTFQKNTKTTNNDLVLIFTVKRLRRKPKVYMRLQYPPSQEESDISLELFAGENLRRALLARGVKLNDPLARRFDNGGSGDCGADGTCATCAVNVVQGGELLSPAGDSESQIMTKRNPRWRMACKVIVGHGMQEGELTLRVNPRQW